MSFTIIGTDLFHNGKPIRLRGAGLGGWLLVEAHMYGIPAVEQHMREAFAEILGSESASRYWEAFQDSYYTEADIAWLAGLGFNLIRVPFNYRLFQDDPLLGRSRARGFELLDRVFGWAQRHGMFVLLDLHAASGSQADDWNADEHDAVTVVAWAAHWLAAYSEWRFTSKWPSEGAAVEAA